jgi:hypothetical protein
MNDRLPRPTDAPPPDRPRSDAHAAQTMSDGAFMAYCFVQGFKLIMALVRKRWPEVG